MKIVLLDAHTANPGDLTWDPLRKLGYCDVFVRTPLEQTVERCAGADVIITNKAALNREIIEALPDLRYIGVAATGYNVVDVAAAQERGIIVTNVPGYSSPAVAQLVFALLLEMTHHVGHHAQTVREGRWAASPDFCYWDFPVQDLADKTLGIVGFGDIGSSVARIALAFGMKVIANRRTWKVAPPEGVEAVELDELFSRSDAISLHCPLTDETRHLIGPRTLALIKPTALLINTGRGPLIDETALAAALNEDRIAGAGLDVLSAEPPAADNPLFAAKNCFITPHIGWASLASRKRLIDAVAANLQAFIDGSPTNVVHG